MDHPASAFFGQPTTLRQNVDLPLLRWFVHPRCLANSSGCGGNRSRQATHTCHIEHGRHVAAVAAGDSRYRLETLSVGGSDGVVVEPVRRPDPSGHTRPASDTQNRVRSATVATGDLINGNPEVFRVQPENRCVVESARRCHPTPSTQPAPRLSESNYSIPPSPARADIAVRRSDIDTVHLPQQCRQR